MASPLDPAGSGTEWNDRWKSGDTPWDKGAAHPALIAWLLENRLSGEVLVPGCGSGNDVRAIATTGAKATGLDIAPSAVEAAKRHLKAGSESYLVGNLFDLPADLRGKFDAVFEHTCFCAIDPSMRSEYVDGIATALRTGGQLLAIFYLNPGQESGPPFGCTPEELDTLFGGKFRLLTEKSSLPTFPGREDCERLRLYSKLGNL